MPLSNENEIEKLEHDDTLKMKKVALYGWTGTVATMLAVTSDGSLKVNFS